MMMNLTPETFMVNASGFDGVDYDMMMRRNMMVANILCLQYSY